MALDTVRRLERDLREMDELLIMMEDDNETNHANDIARLKDNIEDKQRSRENWTDYCVQTNKAMAALTRELQSCFRLRIRLLSEGRNDDDDYEED